MTNSIKDDSIQKTIDIQQSIIARMAFQSGMIKGWSLSLTAAIAAFAIEKSKPELLLATIAPVILFAVMDVYYLHLERQARNKYEAFVAKVRAGTVAASDLFDVKPDKLSFKENCKTCSSVSIWPFYLAQVLGLVAIAFFFSK